MLKATFSIIFLPSLDQSDIYRGLHSAQQYISVNDM